MFHAPPKHEPCLDALRLSAREQAAILQELDLHAQGGPGANLRHDVRMPYRSVAGLMVRMEHPGGSALNYLVKPRNISSGGIGFLHGNFVHIGTSCTITLATVDRKAALVTGKVDQCRHLRKNIHEVGVRFAEAIDLSLFLASFVRAASKREQSTELPNLSGKLLYIEESVADRDLLHSTLKQLNVELYTTSPGSGGVELSQRLHVDLILADMQLRRASGLEIARQLRAKGYDGPIVAVTTGDEEETLEAIRSAGYDRTLVKPYTFEDLIDVLSEYLSSESIASEEALPF